MNDTIRILLNRHGKLAMDSNVLEDDADLYAAGLSSLNAACVIIAIEREFACEFPEHLLSREVFRTVASIHSTLQSLLTETRGTS